MARGGADGGARRHLPWTLAGLSYWAVNAGAVLLATDFSWPAALGWAALGIAPEVLLAPAALALSRRQAWDGERKWRFALVHLAGAIVFVGVALGWAVVSGSVARRIETGVWVLAATLGVVVWRGVIALIVYATVCSVAQAVAFARRAREAGERAARAEALRAEAQLAGLRAQFNPHFILNLLHGLMGLVRRDPPLAAAALERLGDMLRYVLRVQLEGGDQVAFRDEWAFVSDYLELERLRLGDRLRVRLEADAGAQRARLPALLLQPLVENAVRYAVAPRADGGSIAVTAHTRGDALQLTVADDGDGRPPAPAAGAGLGLALARQRLAALYGERAELRAGRGAGGGYVAEITLPREAPPPEELS